MPNRESAKVGSVSRAATATTGIPKHATNIFAIHHCRATASLIRTWRGDLDYVQQQQAVLRHRAQVKYDRALFSYRATCGSNSTHRQCITRMVTEAYHQFMANPSRFHSSVMIPGGREGAAAVSKSFDHDSIAKSWRLYLSVLLKCLLSHLNDANPEADLQSYPTCVRLMALHGIYDASTPVKAHYIVTQKGYCTSNQLEAHFADVEASRKNRF